jgi:hypothetical protein
MAAKGEQIHGKIFYVHRDLSHSLHGIGVHQDSSSFGCSRNLSQRLYRADIVVGQHNRRQRSIISQSTADILRIHQAVFINGQIGNPEAPSLQMVARVQQRLVFDGRCNDVSLAVAETFGDSAHGMVVGLGTTTGKKDLIRSRTDQLGHSFTGSIQHPSRFLSE